MKRRLGLKWPAPDFVSRILQPVLAVLAGLCLGLAVTWSAGENPWHVFKILCLGAFGSPYDFGMTLFYATPLVFTGLSVAIAFHAGLFNIGAEGQLSLGALAAGTVVLAWQAETVRCAARAVATAAKRFDADAPAPELIREALKEVSR